MSLLLCLHSGVCSSGYDRFYSMSNALSNEIGLYSGGAQVRASAWFVRRFSQAASSWCHLDSALYSFDIRTEEKSWRKSVAWWKNQKKNTEKIIDFPIHLPYICHRNLSQFSVRPPGRASACFVKRFSQAVSWWCPLESAPYSLLRRRNSYSTSEEKTEWQQILLWKNHI